MGRPSKPNFEAMLVERILLDCASRPEAERIGRAAVLWKLDQLTLPEPERDARRRLMCDMRDAAAGRTIPDSEEIEYRWYPLSRVAIKLFEEIPT